MSHAYDPVNTYRIQFNKEFTFSDLENIIPYLVKLGVRTVYASPIFHAPSGSMHGYDGINPNEINPEIGTLEQLISISKTLQQNNIGWIQDIVPNHLSFHEENKWLMDVLEKGETSEYAKFFDIDWNHPVYKNKLMVPFPGSPLEEKLKNEFPSASHYAICDWRETDKTINYRRFFTVNSLICVNIQNHEVFEKYHQLIKQLTQQEIFSGLRVDHIDGLYDPKKYLDELRHLGGDETYIVVEKILEPGEAMAKDWPVQGNSGYDFLGMVNNLFTNKKSEKLLTNYYDQLTGDNTPVDEQIRQKKSFILFKQMGGELDNLCRLYKDLGLAKNLAETEIKKLIADYLIRCPVYRYYGTDIPVMEQDKENKSVAVQQFYQRAMQFTGPLMAKGVEDTLMYTYNRFIGHNEVGDSPESFGYSVDEFHRLMEDRASNWPLSMNASSTHDTKRGEDARARLNVLSDLPSEWIKLVDKWKEENDRFRTAGKPDRNDEYFIYQTLIATYPTNSFEEKTYLNRLSEYLQKALREAKQHSGWAEPNLEYEKACKDFAAHLINKQNSFWTSFQPFFNKVKDLGMINSFGQLILKFTCPGVPDLYQGTELWDLSMVDPDNRRHVDYSLREKMLDTDKSLAALWPSRDDAQIKFVLIRKLLKVRTDHSDLFSSGAYKRLEITGHCKSNAIAFLRQLNGTSVISVVPLHLSELIDGTLNALNQADWKDTKIILPATANSNWQDVLNGGKVSTKDSKEIYLKDLFNEFPGAILVSE